MEEFWKMFLFEEWNTTYCFFWVFISLLKVASSFYYFGICANIQIDWYARYDVQVFLIVFESFFLIEILVNFLRKVTPDGKSMPLDTIQKIGWHYMTN